MTTWRARVLSPRSPDAVTWIDDAVVRIEAGVFTEVGPYDGRPVDADLRPGVLIPGFVDAHLHFPQTRIVGSASGPLLDWLATSTFPEEERFAEPSHAALVARHFVDRMAAAGTTLCMAYGSVHPAAADALFTALAASGLRAIAGPVLMDAHSPAALTLPADVALPALEALADRWHGHDDRLQVAVIPRFALSCTPEMLRRAGELARRRGLWVSTHLAENVVECAVARERFDAPDYLSIYEDAGLLQEKSVYAHCIHLSDDEWDRFAASGAVVAHCPDSNDFLGSGGMPLGAVQERAIPLAIGTDVAAGRSFRVPRILSAAYDNALRQGLSLSPAALLWAGTRGGAKALGFTRIGSVEAGFEADACLFRPPPWVTSAEGVLASLIFDHDAPQMARTWVRGRQVWTDGS
ncbi:MAG: guanine deaminase [Myxococcota bacterium]|jgi:guanine deaminase